MTSVDEARQGRGGGASTHGFGGSGRPEKPRLYPSGSDASGVTTTRVLSLGAGVQSSTLLLMACRDEIERPDVAIFVDLGWEMPDTYRWFDTVLRPECDRAGLELRVVKPTDIRADLIDESGARIMAPLFVRRQDGKRGQLQHQCSRQLKMKPVMREARRIMGAGERGRLPASMHLEVWLGISTDETGRIRADAPTRTTWRYPLTVLGMSRSDCERWLSVRGFGVAPRSSCVGCPFRSADSWREMRRDHPEAFAQAVEVDTKVRHLWKRDGELFLHGRMVPLAEAVTDPEPSLFDAFSFECSGMCGV